MYETTYHRPASVEEAVSLFKKASDARYLAGGHTLIPTMKQRLASPSDVIDLARIPTLVGIDVSADAVTIKAATTHHDVAGSNAVRKALPALAVLAGGIGDPQVRHRGTIGGSVANNDPSADYPAGVLALGATIKTNKRAIAADDFFKGLFTTALEEGEVITAISFPIPAKAGYAKFPNPASRYALTGVFVAKTKAGAVRAAATGASQSGVMRLAEIEKALSANWSEKALDGVTVSPNGLIADVHGTAAYRAGLIVTMAKRAVAAAG